MAREKKIGPTELDKLLKTRKPRVHLKYEIVEKPKKNKTIKPYAEGRPVPPPPKKG